MATENVLVPEPWAGSRRGTGFQELTAAELERALSLRPRVPLTDAEVSKLREVIEWHDQMTERLEDKRKGKEAWLKRFPVIFGAIGALAAITGTVIAVALSFLRLDEMLKNPWFQHPRVWFVIGIVGWLIALALAIWAYSPATIVPDRTDTGQYVEAGAKLHIQIPVTRDIDRRCSIDTERFLTTKAGGTYSLGPSSHISAETLRRRESETPGILSLSISIPSDAAPGPAFITTENRYRCLFSPLSWVIPIDDAWRVDFTITPARQGVIILN